METTATLLTTATRALRRLDRGGILAATVLSLVVVFALALAIVSGPEVEPVLMAPYRW